MIKTIALITMLSVVPVNSAEKPPAGKAETVTITKELAEKLVQMRVAQEQENAQLRYEIYQYQMLLYEARTKTCA